MYIGEVYFKMNKFAESRRYLTKAHNMCPSRFYPLYHLAVISEKEHRKEETYRICNEIINKPIKVYSRDVMLIKHKARMMLKNGQTH